MAPLLIQTVDFLLSGPASHPAPSGVSPIPLGNETDTGRISQIAGSRTFLAIQAVK